MSRYVVMFLFGFLVVGPLIVTAWDRMPPKRWRPMKDETRLLHTGQVRVTASLHGWDDDPQYHAELIRHNRVVAESTASTRRAALKDLRRQVDSGAVTR